MAPPQSAELNVDADKYNEPCMTRVKCIDIFHAPRNGFYQIVTISLIGH